MPDINDLLAALKENVDKTTNNYDGSETDDTSLNIQDWKDAPIDATIAQMVKNIEYNSSILEEAKNLAEQTGNPDYIESFASVSKANSENLKILSLLISEREKLLSVEKLKQLDSVEKEKDRQLKLEIAKMQIESKEKIAEGKTTKTPQLQQNNTFNLLATRDAMLDAICGNKNTMKQILEDNGLDQEVIDV